MIKPFGYLDFETHAIRPRPTYPPKPVGVALRGVGELKKPRYFAWGHPEGNNCSADDARRHLKQFARDHRVVCHHAGFDLDVLETAGIDAWEDHHDTLILAFLEDPDSYSLSLKPLAERYLGEPPEEQNKLKDYILAQAKAKNPLFKGADPEKPEQFATEKTYGAYIAMCPVSIVAPYALGDIGRTERLFKKLTPKDPRLVAAYDRERTLTRILIGMERRGVPLATRRLAKDIPAVEGRLRTIEEALWKRMKVPKAAQADFVWSGPAFAQALLSSGIVAELPTTEKGNPSTSAESLATVLPKEIAKEFEVAAQLRTCLGTFMRPWLKQAEVNGHFHARINQVRNGDEWGKKTGARTGRLSMTPNLQNVIRSDKDERVPQLRDYIVPGSEYAALIQRDYSQQELRLLAHFEDGPFLASYIANPDQDGHMLVRDIIEATTGIVLDRRPVKDLNFGLIYGQGLALTAEKMGIPREEAKRFRSAHSASLPGIPALQREIKDRVAADEPIWTWGGRRYFCEKPVFIKGRWMSFEYKMLNKLIQGSAADVTKQAMINYDATQAARQSPMLLQVHDELILGLAKCAGAKALTAYAQLIHKTLSDCMADVAGIAVPMRSDGKFSKVSWHQMKKVKW